MVLRSKLLGLMWEFVRKILESESLDIEVILFFYGFYGYKIRYLVLGIN